MEDAKPMLIDLDAAYADFPREMWKGCVLLYLREQGNVGAGSKLRLHGSKGEVAEVTVREAPSVRLPRPYDGAALFERPSGFDFAGQTTLTLAKVDAL